MIEDPPVDELELRRRKRAQETPVGGIGDAWKSFQPGRQVVCRVVAPEEVGCSVVLVEGQFVCVNGGVCCSSRCFATWLIHLT